MYYWVVFQKGSFQKVIYFLIKMDLLKYCKDYKAYWDWVKHRNESRYQNNIEHGKNYDSKNMMHTFRLLHMAQEIAEYRHFEVRRTTDKEFVNGAQVSDDTYIQSVFGITHAVDED